MEGAEDGALGSLLGPVQSLDEHGDAQDVGEQDELLAGLVARVADGGEETDRGLPLLDRGFDVPYEGVEVAGQALHDLPQPLVLGLPEALHHRVGGGLDGEVHWWP
ncbi:hypothetical protein GCM10017771_61450 [Streptomyces capitiformicae]|uniref:Uncharacterized protein n=1 Tax=Streptomyces capitiformicae TaxID=2014920 RepID=A0A919DG95_9ACTN|nr:hypothetical protein GCM10017771_61450 [Streptomyces capitiformicae]